MYCRPLFINNNAIIYCNTHRRPCNVVQQEAKYYNILYIITYIVYGICCHVQEKRIKTKQKTFHKIYTIPIVSIAHINNNIAA